MLRDVSLQVPAGSTLAVLGRNGAGKSTLLRILATLLRPHAGEVLVFGEALPRRGFAVRGRLGLLAHDPLLYRDLSGRENLGYHARLHGVAPERVEELLEAVGMRDGPMSRCACSRGGWCSASRSAGRCSTPRRCCSSTSPWPISTRRRRSWSGR